jgi:hypothetical protein
MFKLNITHLSLTHASICEMADYVTLELKIKEMEQAHTALVEKVNNIMKHKKS